MCRSFIHLTQCSGPQCSSILSQTHTDRYCPERLRSRGLDKCPAGIQIEDVFMVRGAAECTTCKLSSSTTTTTTSPVPRAEESVDSGASGSSNMTNAPECQTKRKYHSILDHTFKRALKKEEKQLGKKRSKTGELPANEDQEIFDVESTASDEALSSDDDSELVLDHDADDSHPYGL